MNGGRLLASPLSALYGAAVAARARFYRKGWFRITRAQVPVISIGNIVAGGTGKTPMVAMTTRLLRDAGLQPVVVSRGYGGRRREDPLVVCGRRGRSPEVTASLAGDEPVMLATLLPGVPVIVARRRSEGAELAITRFGAGCIVLDDGFQHLALARDLDLVLLDASRPLDGGHLLPAGLLREPPSALGRAHAVFLSGPGPVPDGAGETIRSCLRPGAPVFHLGFEPTLLVDSAGRARPLSALAGRRVTAFAGIARPERLTASLREKGAEVVRFLPFPDHHVYTDQEILGILREHQEGEAELLMTTEKDLARLRGTAPGSRLHNAEPLALRIEGTLPGNEMPAFRELLFGVTGTAGGEAPPATEET